MTTAHDQRSHHGHLVSFATMSKRQSRLLGPVPRKMVKFNPGLSEILSKVFLFKNMLLELTKFFCVFTPRFSDENIEFYSGECTGR